MIFPLITKKNFKNPIGFTIKCWDFLIEFHVLALAFFVVKLSRDTFYIENFGLNLLPAEKKFKNVKTGNITPRVILWQCSIFSYHFKKF